ncbi:DoxX family protein [Brevundimonas sp. VNH65]|uniref:DoxX family protein n=1 Tax=Brevundimonas sp. VNH65 TaxID=3400917 RepID=UPI003C11B7AD
MATTYKTSHTPAQLRLCETYRNLGLWTFQGWIAMFFFAAGYAKLTVSMETLTALMTWPALVDPDLVRGVGIAEVILAAGVLAPLVSWRVGGPILMVAALGLLMLETVMLGVHLTGQDLGLAAVNLILMALTATVLIGRRSALNLVTREPKTLLG